MLCQINLSRSLIILLTFAISLAVGSSTMLAAQTTVPLLSAKPLLVKMDSDQEVNTIFLQGESLSASAVAALERKSVRNPDNLNLHLQLLGYYFVTWIDFPNVRAVRNKHIFWVIRHCSTASFASWPFCTAFSLSEADTYQEAKKLWLEQVHLQPNNTSVLRNTARFLKMQDSVLAKDLLQKALQLKPEDFEVLFDQASAFEKQIADNNGLERKQVAQQALNAWNKAILHTNDADLKTGILVSIAQSAYEAEQFEIANVAARKLLKIGTAHKGNLYGDGVFYGNTVLGQLALRTGNISQAKTYLLAAGKAPAVGVIESFGPSMTLAQELLEKGERETVIEFLHSCSSFWKMSFGFLNKWIMVINQGGKPNFSYHVFP